MIQTFTPDNEVITSAAAQDYNSFYGAEIRIRRARRYPPFADWVTILLIAIYYILLFAGLNS